MKKYIFYTTDGYTQDSQLNETENCQVLGFSVGEDAKKAYENLIKEYKYIQKHNYENIIAYEVVGEHIVL